MPWERRTATCCCCGMPDWITRRSRARPAWRLEQSEQRSTGPGNAWWKHTKQWRGRMQHLDDGALSAYLDGQLTLGASQLTPGASPGFTDAGLPGPPGASSGFTDAGLPGPLGASPGFTDAGLPGPPG